MGFHPIIIILRLSQTMSLYTDWVTYQSLGKIQPFCNVIFLVIIHQFDTLKTDLEKCYGLTER